MLKKKEKVKPPQHPFDDWNDNTPINPLLLVQINYRLIFEERAKAWNAALEYSAKKTVEIFSRETIKSLV